MMTTKPKYLPVVRPTAGDVVSAQTSFEGRRRAPDDEATRYGNYLDAKINGK